MRKGFGRDDIATGIMVAMALKAAAELEGRHCTCSQFPYNKTNRQGSCDQRNGSHRYRGRTQHPEAWQSFSRDRMPAGTRGKGRDQILSEDQAM